MAFQQIPDDEAQAILQGMEQAEKEGFFDGMFTEPCRQPAELPSKDKLLQSIRPGMKLFQSFFMKLYGYGISDSTVVSNVLDRLRAAGCTKGETYYSDIVKEYQRQQAEEQKKVVVHKSEKEGSEERRIKNMSSEELAEGLVRKLNAGLRLQKVLRVLRGLRRRTQINYHFFKVRNYPKHYIYMLILLPKLYKCRLIWRRQL